VALPPRRFLVAACAAIVVGAGIAGIAAAELAPHRSTARPALTGTTARVIPDANGWYQPRGENAQPTTEPTAKKAPDPTAKNAPEPTAKKAPEPTTNGPSGPTAKPSGPLKPIKPAKPTKTEPSQAVDSGIIDQVLAHINAARAQNGLAPLTLSTRLSTASELHNQLMINGCGLSHQCPGEAGLGDRFSAQGVPWTSAGENIGFGSAGSSTAAIVGAANGLTDSMLAEVPPNDGHRRNLLNPGFKHIGLAVERDAKGLVWMTQDFVN
jgi:uncharacterized protein YkwD